MLSREQQGKYLDLLFMLQVMLYTPALVFSGTDKATLEALNKPIEYYFKSYIVDVRHRGHRLASIAGGIMPASASLQPRSL